MKKKQEMKKMKSNKVYSSIFYSAPCSFPPSRYAILPGVVPPSNAQYIFGYGVTWDDQDQKYYCDKNTAGIELVPSVDLLIRRVTAQGEELNIVSPGPKGLRYIRNLQFTFDYYQQQLHNSSVASILLVLKVPLLIDFNEIFYKRTNSELELREDYDVVFPQVLRPMYGNNWTNIDIPAAHNRIGTNKYIIGYEFLPAYNNSYFQRKVEIKKEIVLHSNERIVAFVVSYDLSTRSGEGVNNHGVLPQDPWNESTSHPVDLCFIGWISGIVSYDISF